MVQVCVRVTDDLDSHTSVIQSYLSVGCSVLLSFRQRKQTYSSFPSCACSELQRVIVQAQIVGV